jgi:hypothetical protein
MTAPRLAQVVRADLNPEWAEAVFALECAADGSSRLRVVVWDHDRGTRAGTGLNSSASRVQNE